MNLILEKTNLEDYLVATDIIDFSDDQVKKLSTEVSEGAVSDIELVQRLYEFVRDRIYHSCDLDEGQIVTCRASEVLAHKQGLCYAKSHLLAALLRNIGIPTGFCYQRLVGNDGHTARFILHGLNAVYIESAGKWIRMDARGNKEGIYSQFSLKTERLAYQTKPENGEIDNPVVYANPSENVVRALRDSKNFTELMAKLPSDV